MGQPTPKEFRSSMTHLSTTTLCSTARVTLSGSRCFPRRHLYATLDPREQAERRRSGLCPLAAYILLNLHGSGAVQKVAAKDRCPRFSTGLWAELLFDGQADFTRKLSFSWSAFGRAEHFRLCLFCLWNAEALSFFCWRCREFFGFSLASC